MKTVELLSNLEMEHSVITFKEDNFQLILKTRTSLHQLSWTVYKTTSKREKQEKTSF